MKPTLSVKTLDHMLWILSRTMVIINPGLIMSG